MQMTIELIRRLLIDWPFHFIISASMGLLAYALMETMLYRFSSRAIRLTRGRFLHTVLEFGIGLSCTSLGVFVSLFSHVIWDYYVQLMVF